MYYQKKLINGVLCCRSTPNGEWRPAGGALATAVNALAALTETQRAEALRFFEREA